ncbi:hypothetical protein EMPS_08536 [Entomortierella parvispora]|uniref:Crinkler effector protein N-terminal domain-containing protein n=1 Tax=Entomortierella parvispora TaxID=205924 RepID=A0A9P3LZI9_9FUNG|nr:hypothetical protein EMPS_08536 [Entomortierella parvispora]
MANLFLNCIAFNHATAFSVNIPSTSTVDHLGNAINVQGGFTTLPRNLTLWQVNIPSTASMGQKEAVFVNLNMGNSLNSSVILQTLFPEGAAGGVIHIVFRWKDLLSEYDFVNLHLEDITSTNQSAPGSQQESTREYSLTPHAVRLWRNFLPSVRAMQLANVPLYPRPIFHPRRQANSESTLTGVFLNDMGSLETLPPFARTEEVTSLIGIKYGIPDLVCSCLQADGISTTLLFPVEVKTSGVLHLNDGIRYDLAYHQQISRSIGPARPLRQIYGYMKLNGFRYGVLSTYKQTWFFMITGVNNDELLVSPTIPYNNRGPTVQQCYLWLIRQAQRNGRLNNPASRFRARTMTANETGNRVARAVQRALRPR